MLVDDRRSAVSLPELPLLAVLPGTGGLTRVTDKRKVRRDLSDVFCSTEEGVRGKNARCEWRLVDEVVPNSQLGRDRQGHSLPKRCRAHAPTGRWTRQGCVADCRSTGTGRRGSDDHLPSRAQSRLEPGQVVLLPRDRAGTCSDPVPGSALRRRMSAGMRRSGRLAMGSGELDDAILHLRTNEPELIGLLGAAHRGRGRCQVLAYDDLLDGECRRIGCCARSGIILKRTVLKRLDMTAQAA